ncbi:MAG TPA: hypothetical protein VEX18_05735 [Polyangiaceae bacterium]|nr:hypothetical protein [Polyangiaceae bacterium]
MISKLAELSIVIALIAVPARAARQKDARMGMRKLIIWMLAFDLFYLFALRFLYGRF